MALPVLTDFRIDGEFAEFDKASAGLVNAKIAEATRRCDSTVYGTLHADAVKYLTAHLIAISPFGMNARMVNKEGETTYGKEYERIKGSCGAGLGRTAGDPRVAPTFSVPDDDCW